MGTSDVLTDVFRRIRVQGDVALGELTDAEYFWEPVPGCWTVHRRTDPPRGSVVLGGGEWVHDYAFQDPTPPPFTTIAWRLTHLAVGSGVLCDVAFDGLSDASPLTAAFPSTAAAAVALWHHNFDRLAAAASRSEEDLLTPVPSPWGPPETVASHLGGQVVEHLHHLAEIALLRQLRRCLGEDGSA